MVEGKTCQDAAKGHGNPEEEGGCPAECQPNRGATLLSRAQRFIAGSGMAAEEVPAMGHVAKHAKQFSLNFFRIQDNFLVGESAEWINFDASEFA